MKNVDPAIAHAVRQFWYLVEMWGHSRAYCDVSDKPLVMDRIVPAGLAGSSRIIREFLADDPRRAVSILFRAKLVFRSRRFEEYNVAIAALESAGFLIGPENQGPMVAVHDPNTSAIVWLDVRDTIRASADLSDSDHALYQRVIEVVDGPEARARAEASLAD